ncbi:MAG: HD domain-containing protein [Caldilineaceae bacterium]|nr:HD domain-containing protein [Caldilineaceae bacterium]
MQTDPTAVVEEILALLAGPGSTLYYGEGVTQLDHALQCAKFAADVTNDEELILAALLHDIGHLCDPTATEMDAGIGMIDHEGIGARFLHSRGFSPKLAELVSAHVAAKRYLVATNANYAAQLSAASTATLKHQGGPMTAAEVAAFEQDPLFQAKLRMRAWDEMGKEPELATPPLLAYRAMMVRHLAAERL